MSSSSPSIEGDQSVAEQQDPSISDLGVSSSLELDKVVQDSADSSSTAVVNELKSSPRRFVGYTLIALGIAGIVLFGLHNTNDSQAFTPDSFQKSQLYKVQSVPLNDVNSQLQANALQGTGSLSINGLLKVNKSIILQPITSPSDAVQGQIYFDKNKNQLSYFNGSRFVYLQKSGSETSIGGLTGAISLTTGLRLNDNNLLNAGVLSFNGQSGNVSLIGGAGIALNGSTVTNTGVTSFGGRTGSISVGSGLAMSSGQIRNAGVLSLSSGTPTLQIANDGNGNLTITNTGGGSGNVSTSGGTNGTIALFNGATSIGDSILSQSGATITVGGTISATTLTGNGSGLTALNATNLSSGTVANARLSASVTLQGNTFNGVNQLLQLNGTAGIPALNGSLITNLTASNISSGTLADARLSTNVTLQGNVFNGANELVQLNGTAGLPALNGSQLTNLNASNLSSGTVPDARLSANVPLLNANNNFTGSTLQHNGSDICDSSGNCVGTGAAIGGSGTANHIAKFTAAGTIGDSSVSDDGTSVTVTPSSNSATTFEIQNAGGTTTLLAADTSNNEINLGTDTGLYLSGSTASISNTQGQSQSEAFGNSAAVSSSNATAVGYNASAGVDAVAVGHGAAANNSGTAVGNDSSAFDSSVAVGESASNSSYYSVSVGEHATTQEFSNAIGYSAVAHNTSQAYGYQAQAPLGNELVFGSDVDNAYIQDAYIGSGIQSSSPVGFTLHSTSACDGVNVDCAGATTNGSGASLSVAGGQGTGTGNGGDIKLQIAKPGASGTSLNSLSTVASLSGANGSALFKNSADSLTAFQIQNASGSTVVNVNTSNGQLKVQGLTDDATVNSLQVSDLSGNNLLQVRNDGQVALGEGAANSTIGHTVVGANPDSGNVDLVAASKVTTGGNAVTLNYISAYVQQVDSSPNDKYYLGIYTDSSGSPGTLIAESPQSSLTAGSWNTLAVNANLSASTTYWLAFMTNTTSNLINYVPFDSGGTNTHKYMSGYSTFGSGLPSSFSVSGTSGAIDSIYGIVTGPSTSTTLTVNPITGVDVTTPTNSPTAFQVQNATGETALTVDTINKAVGINGVASPGDGANFTIHGGGAGNGGGEDIEADSYQALRIVDGGNNQAFNVDTLNPRVTSTDLTVGAPDNTNGAGKLVSDSFESGNYGLWAGGSSGGASVDSSQRHSGKYSAELNMSSTAAYARTDFSSSATTFTTGFWFRWHTLGASNLPLMTLYQNSIPTNKVQLYLSTGWNLGVINGATDLGQTANSFQPDDWAHIVMTVNTGTGEIDLYAGNGSNLIKTYTGLTIGTNWDRLQIGDASSNTGQYWMDDVSLDSGTVADISKGVYIQDSLHASGSTTLGGQLLVQPASNSTTALQVQNTSGNNVLSVDTSGGQTVLGAAGGLTGKLVFANGTNGNTVSVVTASQANNVALTIPADTNLTDTICLQTLNNCGGGSGANTALSNLSGTAINTDLQFDNSGNRSFNIAATGAGVAGRNLTVQAGNSGSGVVNGGDLVLQGGATGGSGTTGSVIVKVNGSDSTSAFQVQNASGTTFFTADTTKDVVNTNDLNIGNESAVGGIAGRIFSDSFETGVLKTGAPASSGMWTGTGGSGTISSDITTVRNGKYAAKLVTAANGSYAQYTFGGASTVYGREYFNVGSLGNPTILMDFGTNVIGSGNHLYIDLEASGNLCFHQTLGVSTATACSSTAPTTGAWHKLETRVTTVANGSGTLQVWLDNTLVTSNSNAMNLSGQSYGSNNIVNFTIGNNTVSTATVYYDDVAVDTSATGDSSSANLADSLHVSGSASFSSALKVTNAAGIQVLNVDTANNRVAIGSGSSNSKLFVTGSGQTTLQLNGVSTGDLLVMQTNSNNINKFTYEGSLLTGLTNGSIGSGTVSTTGSTTVNGTTTNFLSAVKAGDVLNIGGDSCTVASVSNNTSLTCSLSVPTHSNVTYTITSSGTTDNVQIGANGQVGIGTSQASPLTNALTVAGSALFENAANSTTAFQVANSSGTNLVNVDTSGNNINLGIGALPSPLGYTTVGGGTGTGYQDSINANKFSATHTGTVTSMSVNIPSPGAGFHYQLAIYGDNSGVPGNYIASSASTALATGWNTASLITSPLLTAGTTYWLVYWTDVNNGTDAGMAYDSPVTGSDFNYITGITYGSGSSNGMPTSWPGGSNDAGTFQHSIYVTYASTGYAVNVSNTGDLSATGAATFVDTNNSSSAFKVQNSSGTNVLNVDTSNKRVSIGSIGTATGQLYVSGSVPTSALSTTSLIGTAEGLYVQGNYAYVVDSTNGRLQIYDISNPASPLNVGQLNLASSTQPSFVTVQGIYAYIANYGTNQMQIVDVSNPAIPTSVVTVSTGTGPRSIAVEGHYAYVVNDNGGGGGGSLQVFDVSNPGNPIQVGSNFTTSISSPKSDYIQGRYLYIANASSATIQVIDVSNPPSLSSVSALNASMSAPHALTVAGRYAYLVDYSANKLNIFDESTPASPSVAGSVSTGSSSNPQGVYVQGRYAFVVDGTANDMKVFDISNPASPTQLGAVSTGTDPIDVQIVGRYAYVLGESSNVLQIFDLGGAYTQQFQAGGTETGTLQVDNNASIQNNLDVRGGLEVTGGTQLQGNVAVNGTAVFTNTTNSPAAFQIQDTSGNQALIVSTNNFAGGANVANATLKLGMDSGTGRSINAAGTINASGADYAEYFYQATPGSLRSGDLVCLNSASEATKCDNSADSALIGAVSTNAGYVGNDIFDPAHPEKTALVSMLGQVPVKVSAANGAIHIGDMLTYSSTPGVAVKMTGPGLAIGQAIQDLASGSDKISTYVHVGYFDPDTSNGSYIQDGGAASLASLNVSGDATLNNLIVMGDATFATLTVQDITVGHILTNGNTPTITAGPTTCTGATVTIKGTDTAGLISITASADCSANGKLTGIAFAHAFNNVPNISLTPGNANSAELKTFVDSNSTTINGFDLSTAASNLTNGYTYKWYYQVIQ